jgi:hypothetical protein
MLKSSATLLFALLIVACGKSETTVYERDGGKVVKAGDGTTTITGPDGEKVVINTEGGSATDAQAREVAASLPKFAPFYPGAKVLTVISAEGGKSGGGGLMVTLLTPDAVDKVTAFYDARMADAGVKAQMKMDNADSATRLVGDDTSEAGAMIVMSRSDDGTTIALTVGSGREKAATAPAATRPLS